MTPGGRPSAANLLPPRWRAGWLVFEAQPRPDERSSPWDVEVRRLAPIPSCWDTCSEADLRAHFDAASTRLLGSSGDG